MYRKSWMVNKENKCFFHKDDYPCDGLPPFNKLLEISVNSETNLYVCRYHAGDLLKVLVDTFLDGLS
jgi:hypothetical protein